MFLKIFPHFFSSGFSPLTPIRLQLFVISRLRKNLGKLGLETQKFFRVFEAWNLGRAVNFVHVVADFVKSENQNNAL